MKFCQKCGKELFDEAVICPGCGCAIAPSPASASASPEMNIELAKYESDVKTVFTLSIFSLVLCLGIGIIFAIINIFKIRKIVAPKIDPSNRADYYKLTVLNNKLKSARIMTSIGYVIACVLIFVSLFSFLISLSL